MKKAFSCHASSLMLALAGLTSLAPAFAQVETSSEKVDSDYPPDPPLTPETLADALSCRSAQGHMAFAAALFLHDERPGWMREYAGKETKGMIGTYAYQLKKPIPFFDRNVDKVWFLKDWIVTALPRADAMKLIDEQHLERAPIKATEQYFRFIDPESGPMLGAFEPTGNALTAMLAAAFGAKLPPSPPSDILFVGCNYAPATRQDFLDMAAQADGLVAGAARDIGEMTDEMRTAQSTTGEQQAPVVTGREAIALIIGNTLEITDDPHPDMVIYFDPNGTARFQDEGPDFEIRHNRWYIDDAGRLCSTHPDNATAHDDECVSIRVSDQKVWIDSSNKSYIGRLLNGNPHGF